ncbi:class I SAM-dependent methyltransferase [Luedemannella helvata]|uniref:Methyltransferase n=1 Tax=Luedemannella helvata TaxID=349315 RepID=A0ABN2KAL8_9ACTN
MSELGRSTGRVISAGRPATRSHPGPAPRRHFTTPADAHHAVQQVVTDTLERRAHPRVLEAGAGKRTRFDVPSDAYVIGVDTDDLAMSRNPRLDERVVADLAAYAAPAASFDLITCWYVLEHVPDPAALVDRFATWIAPGGLVVIAVPNLHSLKALVTKATPHAFHVWFRRHVLGHPQAGRPGHGPYPTTLRRAIAPAALVGRSGARGLVPVFEGYFEDAKQVAFRERIRLTGNRWRAAERLVRRASLGRLDAARSEYVVVLRRV